MKLISLKLTEGQFEGLKALAKKMGLTQSEALRSIIEQQCYLENIDFPVDMAPRGRKFKTMNTQARQQYKSALSAIRDNERPADDIPAEIIAAAYESMPAKPAPNAVARELARRQDAIDFAASDDDSLLDIETMAEARAIFWSELEGIVQDMKEATPKLAYHVDNPLSNKIAGFIAEYYRNGATPDKFMAELIAAYNATDNGNDLAEDLIEIAARHELHNTGEWFARYQQL